MSVVSDSVQPHRLQPTRLPVPGILQARVLEWGAIAFSGAPVEGLPVPAGAQRPLVTHSGNGQGGGVMSKLPLSCLVLSPVLTLLRPHGL